MQLRRRFQDCCLAASLTFHRAHLFCFVFPFSQKQMQKNDSLAEMQTKQKDSNEWEQGEAGTLREQRRKIRKEKEMLMLSLRVTPSYKE